jgi:hypothetical protein
MVTADWPAGGPSGVRTTGEAVGLGGIGVEVG